MIISILLIHDIAKNIFRIIYRYRLYLDTILEPVCRPGNVQVQDIDYTYLHINHKVILFIISTVISVFSYLFNIWYKEQLNTGFYIRFYFTNNIIYSMVGMYVVKVHRYDCISIQRLNVSFVRSKWRQEMLKRAPKAEIHYVNAIQFVVVSVPNSVVCTVSAFGTKLLRTLSNNSVDILKPKTWSRIF